MPDDIILSTIANWQPRFTAQGVDPGDFSRVVAPLDSWADWLDAWVANGDLHADLARDAQARGRSRTAGQAWVRASLSYHFAKFVWMLDMARHQRASELSVAAMAQAHALLDPTAERVEIGFEGTRMVGTLRRPAGVNRPPLVLLIAGLDSTKEEFFHVETVFLERGMATFSLDGPGQGETAASTLICPEFERPVGAALDTLCARQDIDPERVGMLGVSLGGYYAARAAAFEPRIRAVVTSGGPYDYGAIVPTRPAHSRATFMHYSGCTTEEETFAYARRICLEGVAERITQPMLVVFGKRDGLVPWQHAVRLAEEAPKAELWMFDEGNHVCMNMTYRWRPQAADWLGEQLGASA